MELSDKKKEAFISVLNGETFISLSKRYGRNINRIRFWIRDCFYLIYSNTDLDLDTYKEKGAYEVKKARENKIFWFNYLKKYEDNMIKSKMNSFDEELEKLIKDTLKNGLSYHEINFVLENKANQIKKEHGQETI
jgi:hypothetical protein